MKSSMTEDRLSEIMKRRQEHDARSAQKAAEARQRIADERQRWNVGEVRSRKHFELIKNVVGEINTKVSASGLTLEVRTSVSNADSPFAGTAMVKYAEKKDRETDGWYLVFSFGADDDVEITLGTMYEAASHNRVQTVRELDRGIVRESILDYLDVTVRK